MSEEEFALYDSADHLKTEAAIAIFLEAVMEDGGDDPAFVAHALEVVARVRSRMRGNKDHHPGPSNLRGGGGAGAGSGSGASPSQFPVPTSCSGFGAASGLWAASVRQNSMSRVQTDSAWSI